MRKWDGVKTCEVYKMRISVCAFLLLRVCYTHIYIFDIEELYKRTIFGFVIMMCLYQSFQCIYKWIDFYVYRKSRSGIPSKVQTKHISSPKKKNSLCVHYAYVKVMCDFHQFNFPSSDCTCWIGEMNLWWECNIIACNLF